MCAGAPAASRSSMARRRWFSPSANIRSRSELGSTAIVPPRDDAHSSGLEDRPKGPSCQQMFAERTACSVGPAFGTTERQLANRRACAAERQCRSALATLRPAHHSEAARMKGFRLPMSKHAQEKLSKQIERVESEVGRLRSLFALTDSAESGPVSPEMIRAILDTRRHREKLFGPGLFADPGWDIVLELYVAKLTNERVTTGRLCNAAAVPATTALRWVKQLERAGLLVRMPDKGDGRRVFTELSDHGAATMARFFDDCGAGPPGI